MFKIKGTGLFLFVVTAYIFSALSIGDEIEYSGYWFDNRYSTKVMNTSFSLDKTIKSNTNLSVDIEMDQVSEPPLALGRTVDGTTGASRPERQTWEKSDTRQLNRGQIIFGMNQQMGSNTNMGFNLYTSQEIDYDSRAASVNFTQDLRQKNFKVSASAQYTQDRVGFLNTNALSFRNKTIQKGELSFLQLLSPTSYLIVGTLGEVHQGFLSNPYRKVDVNSYEIHPNYRFRSAAWVKLGKYFSLINGAVLLKYRYYQDDWSLKSHMGEFTINKNITSNLSISAKMRNYQQTAVYFYKTRTEANYYSLDEKLAKLQANSFGFSVTWYLRGMVSEKSDYSFLKGTSIYIRYYRYFNDVKPIAYTSNIFDYRLRFEF